MPNSSAPRLAVVNSLVAFIIIFSMRIFSVIKCINKLAMTTKGYVFFQASVAVEEGQAGIRGFEAPKDVFFSVISSVLPESF